MAIHGAYSYISTPAVCSRIFHSCILHPSDPAIMPVPHFQSPLFNDCSKVDVLTGGSCRSSGRAMPMFPSKLEATACQQTSLLACKSSTAIKEWIFLSQWSFVLVQFCHWRRVYLRCAAVNTASDVDSRGNEYFWRTLRSYAASHGSCITYA